MVTNDYWLGVPHMFNNDAKLICMPHHAGKLNPYFWNYFYDYAVSDKEYLNDFDYSFYPNAAKIHRKSHFTQLVAGHPKIDLILEERQKTGTGISTPILLLYPTYVDVPLNLQHIEPATYVKIWGNMISAFFTWSPGGIVVLRPMGADRHHPVMEGLKAKFEPGGRFFLDDEDDNKFWLARADYFVTDYSNGFINFCMTAKKPVVRLHHTQENSEPVRDEWGWVISSPEQFMPLLEEMGRDAVEWTKALTEKQEREMPTLGRNFALLASMIQRILVDDDDPAWLKMDKGDTPSITLADRLRLVARLTKKSGYPLTYLDSWLNQAMQIRADEESPKIWLLFIKRALLPFHDADTPDYVARFSDMWLANALDGLPFKQSVGLIRHLLRKYPEKSAASLLLAATSFHLPGPRKKRALFFLLMEWEKYAPSVLGDVNEWAHKMPQHFSRPVLDKLNRVLPGLMKIPLPLRRLGAWLLGLKKPLARKYWQAHRALS